MHHTKLTDGLMGIISDIQFTKGRRCSNGTPQCLTFLIDHMHKNTMRRVNRQSTIPTRYLRVGKRKTFLVENRIKVFRVIGQLDVDMAVHQILKRRSTSRTYQRRRYPSRYGEDQSCLGF